VNRGRRSRAVAAAVCLSLLTAGCSHISAVFEDPAPKPAVTKPAAAPKPAPVVTPAQRAEAGALNATALEQMRRGAIGPAISNLKRAAKLDPENRQVREDLARALRMRGAAVATLQSDPQLRGAALD
jgi:Flp pilus assembly protein TadD